MSLRTVIVVMLAMSGSFATILALMGYAFGPDLPGRARRPPREVVTAQAPSAAPAGTSAAAVERRPRASGPDVPRRPYPTPEAGPVPPRVAASTDPELARMAQVSSRRLSGVEAALDQQVTALKKSRDEMLAEFAGQLATLSAQQAAVEVAALDDDMAALALKRLAAARRSEILRQLPVPRRGAIEKRLAGAPR